MQTAQNDDQISQVVPAIVLESCYGLFFDRHALVDQTVHVKLAQGAIRLNRKAVEQGVNDWLAYALEQVGSLSKGTFAPGLQPVENLRNKLT